MKFKLLHIVFVTFFISACKEEKTTQISDNTFVYGNKIYKVVDNELTELADLDSKKIRKFEVLKPKQKSLGTSSLSYIKPNATAQLDALYRGNILYFKLNIDNFNDLKENYYPGKFTIEFEDEYGFIINSTEVLTSDLIGLVGDNGKVTRYVYNGKTEMSTDINSSIKTFSVSSTVKSK